MTLFLLPGTGNEWVDSDHPERGSFFAAARQGEVDVGIAWDAVYALPDVQQIKAEALISLRAERDRKLSETDWTQLADSPVDKARWAIYRQELRDLPAQVSPIWPKRPDDADAKAAEAELDRTARTVLFDGKKS